MRQRTDSEVNMQYEKSHYKGYDLAAVKREPLLELEEYSLKAAREGIVLLENKNNMLPLKKEAYCFCYASFEKGRQSVCFWQSSEGIL